MPREEWRKCAEWLWFFCCHVLSRAWLDKFQDLGLIHRKLCRFLTVSETPSRRKFISVFRGSLKTTVILGYVLWLFCWHLARKKPISICYNTATKDNAEAFMADFRETLLHSKFLHELFPEIPVNYKKYRKWSLYKVELKWVKFHVASLDTKQVSRHYTVIINDDLVNDDNAFSEKERANIHRKWKFQKSIITKLAKTKVGLEIDVGTPFHSKDLISWFIKENKTYDKFIVPYAVTETGGIPDPFKRNGFLTFPELFTWEDFQEKRIDQGKSIFASQYKLQVLEDSDRLAYESWLRYWKFLPENFYRTMVIDPAGTEKDENNATGITICDTDERGVIYVVFAEEFYITPMALIDKIKELKKIYNPDETYIEKEKYSITIADTIDHHGIDLNFSFVEHENKSKPDRIHRLKQWFENKRILLGQGQMDLENQIVEYPDCENKDILDSLAYQIRVNHVPDKRYEREPNPTSVETFEQEMERAIRLSRRREVNHDQLF